MGDRATLERIFVIMRRLLLVPMDGTNPIPRKGTTRHECYRALYEIQELLETRRYFEKHLPQTNADRIRAMSDEELAEFITPVKCVDCHLLDCGVEEEMLNGKRRTCQERVLDWLKQESEV